MVCLSECPQTPFNLVINRYHCIVRSIPYWVLLKVVECLEWGLFSTNGAQFTRDLIYLLQFVSSQPTQQISQIYLSNVSHKYVFKTYLSTISFRICFNIYEHLSAKTLVANVDRPLTRILFWFPIIERLLSKSKMSKQAMPCCKNTLLTVQIKM